MNQAELLEQIGAGRKQLEETLAQFDDAELIAAEFPSDRIINVSSRHYELTCSQPGFTKKR